jgi:hypothetical protein
MFKTRTTEFTIKQRDGESPDIKVTRTQYIPVRRFKRSKTKKKKPVDYGVTEEQFIDILNKASQPTEGRILSVDKYEDLPKELSRLLGDKSDISSDTRRAMSEGWRYMKPEEKQEIIAKLEREPDSLKRVIIAMEVIKFGSRKAQT